MKRARRAAAVVIILAGIYALSLLLLGWGYRERVVKRIEHRLAYALRADQVSLGSVDVSLLWGRIEIRNIVAKRRGIGVASLQVAALDVDLPRFGWALVDDTLQKLEVSGATLTLSAVGIALVRSEHPGSNLVANSVIIHDSQIRVLATGLWRGFGSSQLLVREARADNVELSSAMSWLFRIHSLDASLTLPSSAEWAIEYRPGRLSGSAAVLGSKPISVPFTWPGVDRNLPEISRILSLARSVMSALEMQGQTTSTPHF